MISLDLITMLSFFENNMVQIQSKLLQIVINIAKKKKRIFNPKETDVVIILPCSKGLGMGFHIISAKTELEGKDNEDYFDIK